MKRRKFLQYTGSGIVMPGLFGSLGIKAAPFLNPIVDGSDSDKVLVIIQLEGGNDGLNTLIPLDKYSELYNARPIILPKENELLSLEGTDIWKLHPNMTGMRDLYNEGKVKVIESVSYPGQYGSHPTSTDNWLNAVAKGPEQFTGWAGRYLATQYPEYPDTLPDHPPAIEIGDFPSLVFQDTAQTYGMLIPSIANFNDWWIDYQDGEINNSVVGAIVDNSDVPEGYNAEFCEAIQRLDYLRFTNGLAQNFLEPVLDAYNIIGGEPTNNNGLTNKLKVIAKLIAGGLQTKVYLVRHGSYDTHFNHIVSHGSLLKELSSSIKTFMDDLTSYGSDVSKRVIGMTISEFGRTTFENKASGGGTDHGGASCMFLFGDSISGGVLGESPDIPAEKQSQSDDSLEMQFDFRQVYHTLLRHWFCVDSSTIESDILLNPFTTLPIIAGSPCCIAPETPVITGTKTVCGTILYTYSVPNINGVYFDWKITNGTIMEGQGTNEIIVKWNNDIQGKVNVQYAAP